MRFKPAPRGAIFFREVLDTVGPFDTFVHYCHCAHNLDWECPPLFQESQSCLHTPGGQIVAEDMVGSVRIIWATVANCRASSQIIETD